MDTQLLATGSEALRKAALNQDAKNFVLSNPLLFATVKKAANRYIGGESLEETIHKVKLQNARQIKCSIEFMGENTSTEQEANEATKEFIRICQAVNQQKLYSTVSLDLSHIGLKVSPDLCAHNLSIICQEAMHANTEVIISAEGHEATNAVINLYLQAVKQHSNLAITMQAYLHRSQDDFKALIKAPGRIRIVKGAFETPQGISMPRGDKLDEVYIDYVDQLLQQRHLCSIATHDHHLQQIIKQLVLQHQASADLYEFESLFGICNEQLDVLQEEGFKTKIYFVYGREWYLYLCNRIAEYPLNIFQAIKDIVE